MNDEIPAEFLKISELHKKRRKKFSEFFPFIHFKFELILS